MKTIRRKYNLLDYIAEIMPSSWEKEHFYVEDAEGEMLFAIHGVKCTLYDERVLSVLEPIILDWEAYSKKEVELLLYERNNIKEKLNGNRYKII